MKPVAQLISRRQADGTYRVWASDGAQHHLLGAVRPEARQGPRKGKRMDWHPVPVEGLDADTTPAGTLGGARRQLLDAWTMEHHRRAQQHGLPGVFIVVEGGDGAGKTTLVAALVRALSRLGHAVCATEEPSRGPVGRLLRETLAGRGLAGGEAPTAQEWALLYAADRAHHLREGVLPALARGEVVVCSRYVLSSLAYQGPALGMDWVLELNRHAPAPDVLLFLDVPAEVGLARVDAQRPADSFENTTRACAASSGYARGLELLERQALAVVRLDASQSEDVVRAAALAAVVPLLKPTARAVAS